jgi:DNA repair protein RadC
MAITDWIIDERPREKLLAKGPGALSDAELLAILLSIGKKGSTAIDLARELLTAFGGLKNLLEADQKTLCTHKGIGPAKYAQLQAPLEIIRRQLQKTLEHKDVLTNSTATKYYLTSHLHHHKREVFACLFLDNRNQVICYEELFYGTINNSTVHPREVVKKALACNAAAVILAHNHPSGISEPSPEDKNITKILSRALALVEIKVLDHIIVGDGRAISLLEYDPKII